MMKNSSNIKIIDEMSSDNESQRDILDEGVNFTKALGLKSSSPNSTEGRSFNPIIVPNKKFCTQIRELLETNSLRNEVKCKSSNYGIKLNPVNKSCRDVLKTLLVNNFIPFYSRIRLEDRRTTFVLKGLPFTKHLQSKVLESIKDDFGIKPVKVVERA